MEILSKEELEKKLFEYYITHYGPRKTDILYDPCALNVRSFKRGDSYITLKCHIITGKVTEHIKKGE
ncbi:MAG: hypothetical protein IKT46_02655 [Clostridia bacterium]|nr:hypothetical protein [Clostridia bacterium]